MFFDTFKNICNKKNTTPTTVLKKLNISTSKVTAWKNGSTPNGDILLQLSQFLNVSVDFLLTGKEKFPFNNLNKDEEHLLNNYKKLSPINKARVSERAETLVQLTNEKIKVTRHPRIEIKHSYYASSAGTGYYLDDNNSWETISVPDTPTARCADYTITVNGDSMEPDFFDGDIVFVKEQPCVEIGEIGIFVVNGEGYIKKYGSKKLISLNDDYEDIPIDENVYMFKCCGKVIGKV